MADHQPKQIDLMLIFKINMKSSTFANFDKDFLSLEKSRPRRICKSNEPSFAQTLHGKKFTLEVSNKKPKFSPIVTQTPSFIHTNWNLKGHKLKAIISPQKKKLISSINGSIYLNFVRPITSNALPPSKLKHRRHISIDTAYIMTPKIPKMRPSTANIAAKTTQDLENNVKVVYRNSPKSPNGTEILEEYEIKSPFVYKHPGIAVKYHKRTKNSHSPYADLKVISNSPLQLLTAQTPVEIAEPAQKSFGLQVDDFSNWEFPQDPL